MLFGNNPRQKLDLYLGGQKIIFEKVVRFLGLYLHPRLTFNAHFKVIKERCEDLNMMRMLTGTDYGSDKKSLLVIYKSLIIPKTG